VCVLVHVGIAVCVRALRVDRRGAYARQRPWLCALTAGHVRSIVGEGLEPPAALDSCHEPDRWMPSSMWAHHTSTHHPCKDMCRPILLKERLALKQHAQHTRSLGFAL